MAYKLLGKNFTPPDVIAKVTGKAKYADDFHVDGMVHEASVEPGASRARCQIRCLGGTRHGRCTRRIDRG